MYKPNKRHLQPLLISNISDFAEKHQQRLEHSWAGVFYREFFTRLKEEPMAKMYADCPSRPNVPVNVLVGLETLKAGFGWSDEELYDHYIFDVQVRYALGYRDLKEGDFDLRTLYNFRQRLSHYNQEHAANLLAQAFVDITDQQMASLKLDSSQQRMDSTQIASNIQDASRLQLLVEALQRLHRILSEEDQQHYAEAFAPYLKGHSGQYVYPIKGKAAFDQHIQEIGVVMNRLLAELGERYEKEPVYQVFKRFFNDNFSIAEQQMRAKNNEEISADCLQSFDDLEASYREKGNKEYKGYVANFAETCHPNNPVQLITNVQVAPNTTEDEDLLVEALPELKERTGLETLYTDGAYGGPKSDPALNAQEVELIPSAIKGRAPYSKKLHLFDFAIEQNSNGTPVEITCPGGQIVKVQSGHKKQGFTAHFETPKCLSCPFHIEGRCPAQPGKKQAYFRMSFSQANVNLSQRRRRCAAFQQADKNLRVAVEATVRQVKHPFPASKLPVRGRFRVTCMIIASAAMVNVRRIQSYLMAKIKQEKLENGALAQQKCSQEQQGVSFFAFLTMFLGDYFRPPTFFKQRLSC
jgi:hypothetical protein